MAVTPTRTAPASNRSPGRVACWRPPAACSCSARSTLDRKSTRLNSSHTVIYTLSLHDALPIYGGDSNPNGSSFESIAWACGLLAATRRLLVFCTVHVRSEEHTSELQSHSDLHSFPTRRSSDLWR